MRTLSIENILSRLRSDEALKQILGHMHRGMPFEIEGPKGGFIPFLVGELHKQTVGTSLVVVANELEAENFHQDMLTYFEAEAGLFPWWEVLPYEQISPLPITFGKRAQTLTKLAAGKMKACVVSLRTLLAPVPPREYIASLSKVLRCGDSIDPLKMSSRLQELGYLRVPRVSVHGEFALRGEVLDLFPGGNSSALRIVFDFEEITEMKLFDPLTQNSVASLQEALVPPLREVVLTEKIIATLEQNLAADGAGPELIDEVLQRIQMDPECKGVHHLYPLCFQQRYSLIDYLDTQSVLFLVDSDRLSHSEHALAKEYRELHRQAVVKQPPAPSAARVLLDLAELTQAIPRRIMFPSIQQPQAASPRVKVACDPPRSFFGNIPYLRQELESLTAIGYTVFIFAVYEHQAERIAHMLKDLNVQILPLSISSGFTLPQLKLMVIQENEIFGRKQRIPRSVGKTKSQAIDSFVDLNSGDYVVHVNHGIGRFEGLVRMKSLGNERDYLELCYAEKEKLFVPIEQVNLIQRYVGQESKKLQLDKLGGKAWDKRKKRVRRSVEELAQRLIRLYSRRKTVSGNAFPSDTEWQSEFDATFPYQETEDQLKCIEEVKRDMESPHPMDRLVCGDVGYGKTEIALRAAFKAVMGGKQAAMLAPTTILVEQHYETFQERFQKYPVRLRMLSRFLTSKEQKKVLADLESGQVDIVIGTHRLIQNDVRFKALGLLVIDEEQRFGVKHKERLKELRTSVDCLTLTATPIPRTLHMSLMRIRDMSILNTPPQNRLPIETLIQEYDENTICEAVRRETDRGGQVYYLHNRVETIPEIFLYLKQLLPDVSMDVAHGQMDADELEDVMHRFIAGRIQLLLSTTIIENGLDIPNVNTIVIDRADMFGVAQLYQLRGRVGRAGEPAFAYLFYPRNTALSEIAMKRLRIISDHTELGSGFKIALKDLEIRGAGNLLGREQHGDILAVGFDMYVRILDEAIAALSEEAQEQAPEVFLELEYSGFIPDQYISDQQEKMEVYKRIAAITTDAELDSVYVGLGDRFGPLPDEVASVLSIAEIRIACRKLYIASVKENAGIARVEFAKLSRVPVDRVLRLIGESGSKVYLDAEQPNCLLMKTAGIGLKDKSEFIKEKLSYLL